MIRFHHSALLCCCLVIALSLSCNGTDLPSAGVPENPNGNFHLYVSNQSSSLDSVDIQIKIDDELYVSSFFSVGDGHNWRSFTFDLPAGKHDLTAISSKGGAEMSETFDVVGEHWAVVDYWYRGYSFDKHLSFSISDEPIGVD